MRERGISGNRRTPYQKRQRPAQVPLAYERHHAWMAPHLQRLEKVETSGAMYCPSTPSDSDQPRARVRCDAL